MTTEQLISLCLASTLVCLLPSSLDLLLRPNIEKFKLSLINSSLVFFLFSFQVHEKSIIIAALAVCLQILDRPFWCIWFSIISTFSMLPLLTKDGLVLPSIASTILFSVIAFKTLPVFERKSKENSKLELLTKCTFTLSILGAILLTVASLTLKPPARLPDLFPVMVSVYSCGHFILFLIYFHVQQFQCNNARSSVKTLKKMQ